MCVFDCELKLSAVQTILFCAKSVSKSVSSFLTSAFSKYVSSQKTGKCRNIGSAVQLMSFIRDQPMRNLGT
jgi:hypothetical protein